MENKDYEIIFVDAQIILHRNWCMIRRYCSDMIQNPEEPWEVLCHPTVWNYLLTRIITTVFQSFRKIMRAYSSNKIILLWDRSPYYNALKIKEISTEDTYKADREYEYDPIGEKMFQLRQAAKYYIINNYNKFGLLSYIHKGYEADYLGRICATLAPSKSALASHDSDWNYYMTPNCCELINTQKYTLRTFDQVKEECLGADPWTWNVYHSSFYGSHNNLLNVVSKEYYRDEFEDTLKRYQDGTDLDRVFTDFKLLTAQIESWNYKAFPEYDIVESELRELIERKIEYPSEDEWLRVDKSSLGVGFYREIKSRLG